MRIIYHVDCLQPLFSLRVLRERVRKNGRQTRRGWGESRKREKGLAPSLPIPISRARSSILYFERKTGCKQSIYHVNWGFYVTGVFTIFPHFCGLTELSEDSEFGLCSYDMMLPDSATIYGRLFLGAWDAGLDNVADDTVSLMLHATEVWCSTVLYWQLVDSIGYNY